MFRDNIFKTYFLIYFYFLSAFLFTRVSMQGLHMPVTYLSVVDK